MSESLGDLKAIIDNAPEGAVSVFDHTYLDGDGRFYSMGFWFGTNGYIKVKHPTRSLSDIKRIIELMERVKAGYEAYTRIESVKQRYNAENKQLKELLRGVAGIEDLDDCNFLAVNRVVEGE